MIPSSTRAEPESFTHSLADPPSLRTVVGVRVGGEVNRIVIVKWDTLHAEALKRLCHEVFPRAQIVLYRSAVAAVAALENAPADLTVTGLAFDERDVFAMLPDLRRRSRRLLVVSGRQDDVALIALKSARLDGLFDPNSDSPERLSEVLVRIMAGERVISECFRSQLAGGVSPKPLVQWLTPAELQVFSIIGDGSDNQEAAERLGISALTVQAHRRAIMRKLNLSTSTKLVLAAIRLGVVRVTSDGRAIPVKV